MKNSKIFIERIFEGKRFQNDVDRKEIIKYFTWLKDRFPDDNEISKKLLTVLDEVDCIYMNDDENANREVPFIEVVTNEERNIIKIIRHHKIVWTKLRELTSL